MRPDRSAPLPNYLRSFGGERIYLSGCGEVLRSCDEQLKRLCKPSMRKYYLNGHSAVPVDIVLGLAVNKQGLLRQCYASAAGFASYANPPHRLPKELTPQLAYFVGALRDGCVTGHNYSVRISQSGPGAAEWLEEMRKICNELFGLPGRMSVLGNEHRLELQSKPVAVFVRKVFEMPFDQSKWGTPKLIARNKEAWIPYVSGFFDAEGYCTSAETYHRTGKMKLSFSQNNHDSLRFIKKVLEAHGIATSRIYLETGRKCYALYVQSRAGIIRFAEIFAPIRKRARLAELLTVIKDT